MVATPEGGAHGNPNPTARIHCYAWQCSSRVAACHARTTDWDARAEALFNGNTIFPHRHFRPSRWAILAYNHSIPPQRIDGTIRFAIAAPFWLTADPRVGTVSTDGVTVKLSSNPQALKLAPGAYEAPVTFTNLTNGQGTTRRTAKVTVQRAAASSR